MIRQHRSKEELMEAFQHALGAREAFEDLVRGKIDKAEFEGRGYKMMQIA